ncbi:MAG TPA: shikimate kinase [Dehalococcoidia bacterium]|nr:shikimate kinase [Dehalococcoidia bacterium]
MKSNIALIGFMGTGKSAVGKAVAGKLGREFVEMDSLIEEMAGKPIPDIFEQDGEIAFRELEIEATKRVAQGSRQVIACGGGMVLNKINVDRLRETSRMVYLKASPRKILERTSADANDRPLLDVTNPAQRIRELLDFRKPFYERSADIIVNTSRLSTDKLADLIIHMLKEDEGFNL